jgi:hypothetical protein
MDAHSRLKSLELRIRRRVPVRLVSRIYNQRFLSCVFQKRELSGTSGDTMYRNLDSSSGEKNLNFGGCAGEADLTNYVLMWSASDLNHATRWP